MLSAATGWLRLIGHIRRHSPSYALAMTAIRAITVTLIVLVAALLLPSTAPGASAVAAEAEPLATASSLHSCKERFYLYEPRSGGYALIIEKLHVQRIACKKAANIGGAYIARDYIPVGWHCATNRRGTTACHYKHSRHKFRFVFGGDAG